MPAAQAKSIEPRRLATATPFAPAVDGKSQDLNFPAAPGKQGAGAFGPIAAIAAGALALTSMKSRRRRS
jgi:hypothetical protein